MRLRTLASLRTHTPAIALAAVSGAILSLGIAYSASAEPVASAASAPITRTVDLDASFRLNLARAVSASASGKVDTTQLDVRIAQLEGSHDLPDFAVTAFTDMLRETTDATAQAVTAYDAEQARLAAEAEAKAQADAEALARVNTPDGARAVARTMAADQYGWGDDQFSCLSSLWQKESSWNYQAYNPSGATGIPQALPGSKMASAGSDWKTNAATQIAWGLGYISSVYGTPCSAWGHSQATNWY